LGVKHRGAFLQEDVILGVRRRVLPLCIVYDSRNKIAFRDSCICDYHAGEIFASNRCAREKRWIVLIPFVGMSISAEKAEKPK
jgi:hypothetical protein